MKVVDASAVVELLLESPLGRRVDADLGIEQLAAPELLDVEVLSALARLTRAEVISDVEADRARALLTPLPVQRIGHGPLVNRAWELRNRVRVTDAFYVACAEHVGGSLVTTDGRLARAPLPGVTLTYVQ